MLDRKKYPRVATGVVNWSQAVGGFYFEWTEYVYSGWNGAINGMDSSEWIAFYCKLFRPQYVSGIFFPH